MIWSILGLVLMFVAGVVAGTKLGYWLCRIGLRGGKTPFEQQVFERMVVNAAKKTLKDKD